MNFRDFWYIVAESKELTPKKLLGRKILDESLVVFRDEDGKVNALQDRCLHRSAQLSQGRWAEGKVQCPYHGWIYNSEGSVVHIPSEGPGKPSFTRRCARKYSVMEHQDYVYVRLSENPQEEFLPYKIPHYQEKGWRTIRLINRFKNSVTHCAENFVDIPHTVFVHPKIFRNTQYQKFGATVSRSNGGVHINYRNESSNLGWFSWFLNPSGREILHTDQFEMPNITHVRYEFGPRRIFLITSQSVPISEYETLVYTDLTYDYGVWNLFAGPIIRWQAQTIIDQDVKILSNQGEMVQKYGEQFANTSADVIHLFIESIRNEISKGSDPRKLPEKMHEIEFWV